MAADDFCEMRLIADNAEPIYRASTSRRYLPPRSPKQPRRATIDTLPELSPPSTPLNASPYYGYAFTPTEDFTEFSESLVTIGQLRYAS